MSVDIVVQLRKWKNTTDGCRDRMMDEAADEITRLRAAEAERDQLRAEVEALREDAERYRWLRDATLTVDWSWFVSEGVFTRARNTGSKEMDRVIDAARAKEQK